jgi:hypothetical protein
VIHQNRRVLIARGNSSIAKRNAGVAARIGLARLPDRHLPGTSVRRTLHYRRAAETRLAGGENSAQYHSWEDQPLFNPWNPRFDRRWPSLFAILRNLASSFHPLPQSLTDALSSAEFPPKMRAE